jgi:hypothetical protein
MVPFLTLPTASWTEPRLYAGFLAAHCEHDLPALLERASRILGPRYDAMVVDVA